MNLLKFFNASLLILSVDHSFAATDIETNPVSKTEGASHFSSNENAIYQANISIAMDYVFSNYFSKEAIRKPNSYFNAMHGCAAERSTIANLCVSVGLDPDEALAFNIFRPHINDHGAAIFTTPLTIEDNKILYDALYQKFIQGTYQYGSLSAQLHTMTSAQRKKFEDQRNIKLSKIQSSKSYTIDDIEFFKQDIVGEVECYHSLLTTDNTVNIFKEHPELGTSSLILGGIYTGANAGVEMATLRFSVSLDGAESIDIGSASCLARRVDGGCVFYKIFVLDHVKSNHIEPLLNYAQKNWLDSLNWDHADTLPFLESLARSFWAQTIATPYQRGSESVAKMMLTLTARYHDEELSYRPDFAFRMPFALSVEEFTEYFKANVFLTRDLAEDLV